MNTIVGNEKDYKDFLSVLRELDDEDFPIMLEREDPMDITMPEIKEFIDMFKKDSGLDISFHIKTCDDCGQLHLTMVVDLKESIQYGKLHILQ